MLTTIFASLGWTRDDLKWTVGIAAAVVIGLAALSDTAAGAFGIPLAWLPYIRLAAFVVGLVSAKMSTSGLEGKKAAWLLPLALLVGVAVTPACAHARHTAVIVDASFADAVFALDDAELQACQQHALTAAQCDAANPKIKQALSDVKAVTQALQATPKSVAVPKNLPDLLADLTQVQAILAPAASVPQAQPVLSRVQAAIDQAIAIVRLIATRAGGQ